MDATVILNTFNSSGVSGKSLFFLAMSAILLVISSFVGITRCFHMLQQNSYFNKRYAEWCRNAPKERAVIGFLCFAALTIFLCFDVLFYLPVFIISLVVFVIRLTDNIRTQKKAIKPLVFTGRVKRMYFTCSIISAGLIVMVFLCRQTLGWVVFTTSVLLFAMPVYAMLINLINRPVEKLIARYFVNDAKRILRSRNDLITIGITGSYGKTGTKFILGRFLSEKYNVTVTPENFNTTMGVVRTVREHLKPESEIFVCEMGAKQVGDIKEICDIVKPCYGLITSIGPQHLNTFGNIENIVKTKFELADSVFLRGGEMFLNGDNEYIRQKAESLSGKIVFYGSKNADVTVEDVVLSSSGSEFSLVFTDGSVRIRTKLLGRHNIQNIAGAAALAHSLGVGAKQLCFAAASLKPAEHRLELKSFIGGSTLIDDAYNSNPSGCLEAVNVLGAFDGFKKVIITPGLVELGDKEHECNKALGKAAAEVCDEIFFVGINRSEPLIDGAISAGRKRDEIHVCKSFKEALGILSPTLDRNTVVLIENDLPDNYLN